ncbi:MULTISPECIES: HEPN domain-containing protein [unclassified Acidovorax]|uniref:HEPN domain-containing protein n=1 Tax=unclassified Acidovorax TaxID=2684926 RepID=UPI001C47AED5|nr:MULTISPECIES: HEPN domain-containing protein [unclassified Acidovorax]MBV7460468.1 hypothetical protein [Acidovorax sp. sif0632]MBV7465493.1 hypothetical protein [Acidovorax sp. sif0613]
MKATNAAIPLLHIGLTELQLQDVEFDFGNGLILRSATSTFSTPLIWINKGERSYIGPVELGPDGYPPLPPPAMVRVAGHNIELTAELVVPGDGRTTWAAQFTLARFIVALIRLWINPAVGMLVMSNTSFTQPFLERTESQTVFPLETTPRHTALIIPNVLAGMENLGWIKDRWTAGFHLYAHNAKFRLAVDALDNSQFVNNQALALVSIWGAMEQLFLTSRTELSYRLSSLVACYLEKPGQDRINLHKAVQKLYGKRSSAAHGTPKHDTADLVDSFQLLRRVLLKMIYFAAVPAADELEGLLFEGAEYAGASSGTSENRDGSVP